ncbi:hypothetical protein ADUPG1_009342 [Aduncisulcus paluster]|uniref:Coatomer alpha subunit C-terminal domain-containing protein n=1 Tax=Aduncisulcus paluster TaxID=2918883 RepID=A0ABQ5KV79_9EUKA|nr:hypothetical protein ADUPG1_009342 [Aduncisulcus paluster]
MAGRAKKAALGTVILRYFMAKKRPDLGLAFATGKTKLKLALKVRDFGIAMQEAEKRVQAAERAHEQEMHKLKLSSSSTITSNTSTLSLSTDLLECAEIFLLISTVSRQSCSLLTSKRAALRAHSLLSRIKDSAEKRRVWKDIVHVSTLRQDDGTINESDEYSLPLPPSAKLHSSLLSGSVQDRVSVLVDAKLSRAALVAAYMGNDFERGIELGESILARKKGKKKDLFIKGKKISIQECVDAMKKMRADSSDEKADSSEFSLTHPSLRSMKATPLSLAASLSDRLAPTHLRESDWPLLRESGGIDLSCVGGLTVGASESEEKETAEEEESAGEGGWDEDDDILAPTKAAKKKPVKAEEEDDEEGGWEEDDDADLPSLDEAQRDHVEAEKEAIIGPVDEFVPPAFGNSLSHTLSLKIPSDMLVLEESVNTLQQRFTKGKFKDIHEVFSVALKRCMFVLASREYVSAEKDKGEKPLGDVGVLQKCQEYISAIKLYTVAMYIQALIRQTADLSAEVMLRLSSYSALLPLQKNHRILCVKAAMMKHYKAKNFKTASDLAQMLLSLAPGKKDHERAEKVRLGSQGKDDTLDSGYNVGLLTPQKVCMKTFDVLSPSHGVQCGCCGAWYSEKISGETCEVCGMGEIGKVGSGHVDEWHYHVIIFNIIY